MKINSLVPERFFENTVFKLLLLIDIFKSSHDNDLGRMPEYFANHKSTLVQVRIWCHEATSPYPSQCWLCSRSPYGITGPQWVNPLWPSDAICRHRSGSTLNQVMAFCLVAPSHYLNQCWHINNKIQWYPSQVNFTKNTLAINQLN